MLKYRIDNEELKCGIRTVSSFKLVWSSCLIMKWYDLKGNNYKNSTCLHIRKNKAKRANWKENNEEEKEMEMKEWNHI